MTKTFFCTVFLTSLLGCSSSGPSPVAPHADPVTASPYVAIALKNPSFNPTPQGQIADWLFLEHGQSGSYSFVADTEIARSQPTSARIRRNGTEIYGLLAQNLVVKSEWLNKSVRLSGYLRTESVDGTGGALVLQSLGGGGNILTWNHMNDQKAKGTQDWQRYAVDIKIPQDAASLRIGVMLEDGGTLWADDLTLELVD